MFTGMPRPPVNFFIILSAFNCHPDTLTGTGRSEGSFPLIQDPSLRSEVVKKSWQMLKNSGKMGAKQITTGEHERNSFYPSPRMP
ncbi:MAG: hypothetical protein AAGU04_05020, partial [Anaerolineaceae bacterium]